MNKKLYVGGLSYSVTDSQLQALFREPRDRGIREGRHGPRHRPLTRLRVRRDEHAGRGREGHRGPQRHAARGQEPHGEHLQAPRGSARGRRRRRIPPLTNRQKINDGRGQVGPLFYARPREPLFSRSHRCRSLLSEHRKDPCRCLSYKACTPRNHFLFSLRNRTAYNGFRRIADVRKRNVRRGSLAGHARTISARVIAAFACTLLVLLAGGLWFLPCPARSHPPRGRSESRHRCTPEDSPDCSVARRAGGGRSGDIREPVLCRSLRTPCFGAPRQLGRRASGRAWLRPRTLSLRRCPARGHGWSSARVAEGRSRRLSGGKSHGPWARHSWNAGRFSAICSPSTARSRHDGRRRTGVRRVSEGRTTRSAASS